MSQNFPREYTPAVLRENKHWYIEFSYYDDQNRLRRVRKFIQVAIKRLPTKALRRRYGLDLCFQINAALRAGWRPGVHIPSAADASVSSPSPAPIVFAPDGSASSPWRKVVEAYRCSLDKLEAADLLRKHTKNSYNSYMNVLDCWVCQKPAKISLISELNADVLRSFLDWLINDRGVSLSTRDYYLGWLRTFGGWLVDAGHLSENPTSGLRRVISSRRKKDAARQAVEKYYISRPDRTRIFDFFALHDKYMLLVCYLLYYMFVRPKEISYLRIKYLHVKERLLFIPAEISKNRTDAFVTIPNVAAALIDDLGLLSMPGDYLIFSRHLRPGLDWIRADQLRDAWDDMRGRLDLPATCKLYNLKHTGITDMTDRMPEKLVQQQARHWSVTMTERYIQRKLAQATPEIEDYE